MMYIFMSSTIGQKASNGSLKASNSGSDRNINTIDGGSKMINDGGNVDGGSKNAGANDAFGGDAWPPPAEKKKGKKKQKKSSQADEFPAAGTFDFGGGAADDGFWHSIVEPSGSPPAVQAASQRKPDGSTLKNDQSDLRNNNNAGLPGASNSNPSLLSGGNSGSLVNNPGGSSAAMNQSNAMSASNAMNNNINDMNAIVNNMENNNP